MISAIVPISGFPNGTKQIESWLTNPDLRHFEVMLIIDSNEKRVLIEVEKIESVLSQITRTRVLYSNARNPGGTRNLGLASAKGEWVVFWDCDDTPNPAKVLEMVRHAINARADIAIGEFHIQSENNRQLKTFRHSAKFNILEAIAANPGIWRFAFKSEIAKSFYFRNMQIAEDQIYLADILAERRNLYIFRQHVYTYWQYSNSQMTKKRSALNQIVDALDIMIDKYRKKPCFPIFIVILRLTISVVKNSGFKAKTAAVSKLFSIVLWSPKGFLSISRAFKLILDSK